jgi:hypothetical protein
MQQFPVANGSYETMVEADDQDWFIPVIVDTSEKRRWVLSLSSVMPSEMGREKKCLDGKMAF